MTWDLGTVLGVWAHPDDEAYLSSALMAQAVRERSRVVCVTATRGEGGSLDEEKWPAATLAAVREQELLRCLDKLGVTEHIWLDLPDVDMDTALPASGAAKVLRIMREVQPDTVLTFGPEGMTGHVGHQSVSQWTTDAFHRAAPSGSRLYYAVHLRERAEGIEERFLEIGAVKPGVVPLRDKVDLNYVLEPEMFDLKYSAIREHESQIDGVIAGIGEDLFRHMLAVESFELVATQP